MAKKKNACTTKEQYTYKVSKKARLREEILRSKTPALFSTSYAEQAKAESEDERMKRIYKNLDMCNVFNPDEKCFVIVVDTRYRSQILPKKYQKESDALKDIPGLERIYGRGNVVVMNVDRARAEALLK